MSDNVVTAIIGLVGVIIGAFLSFGIKLLHEYINRPQIKIEQDVPMISQTSVSHGIRISNPGKTAVKNCIVLLTINNLQQNDINIYPSAFLHPNDYRPVIDEPLCWSFQTYSPNGELINPPLIDIYPKSSRLLDLCIAFHGNPGNAPHVEIPSEAGWKRIRADLKGNKEYDVELKVNAENVRYNPKYHSVKFKIKPASKDRFI